MSTVDSSENKKAYVCFLHHYNGSLVTIVSYITYILFMYENIIIILKKHNRNL